MKFLKLKDGIQIPRLGQGTWYMGDDPRRRPEELAALKAGIGKGMTLIDSAEMYGDGRAESLVGELVPAYARTSLFLVSKVYPHNADRRHIFTSCEASLRRMNAESLDLYLLHWRGSVPLEETVLCMEELIERGMICRWGVSNFDTDDLEELFRIKGGENCAVNQVLYHLGSRGVEYSLLPWMESHGLPLMAYCPLAQAGALRWGLLSHPVVLELAGNHGASPIQILLAFLLTRKNVFAIPRSGRPEHTLENAGAAEIELTQEELDRLDHAFPPPRHKTYLDMV